MRLSFVLVCALLCSSQALAEGAHFDTHRVDSHAPIGVMGDHTHAAGEWMASYRYGFMDMHGMRSGQADRSSSDVLRDFLVTPKKMHMMMHMFGLMFAPSDELTLTAMVPFMRLSMNHQTRPGGTFKTRSSGLGDLKLGGLYRLQHEEESQLHAGFSLSIPTGTITARDDTPAGRSRLPYPMQLGSGTVDLLPSITWLKQHDRWSGGAQANAVLRFYQNRHDYQLGNQGNVTAWLARQMSSMLSVSLRLDFQVRGNIHGADSDIAQRGPGAVPLVPTADPGRQARRRLDVGFGVNLLTQRWLPGHRLAIEYLVPVYDQVDGPALGTDWRVVAGWQKAF